MNAVQRRARKKISEWGFKVELELKRAERATSDRWREYHLWHAADYADLALRIAPSTQPPRGAA